MFIILGVLISPFIAVAMFFEETYLQRETRLSKKTRWG